MTSSGFTVTDGATTVTGPAGVAPVGTTATLSAATTPELPDQLGWEPAASAFGIAFSGGAQPDAPVTVTLALPAKDATREGLAFVTRNSATGKWEGLPVSRDGARASVMMRHFSTGVWAWAGSVTQSFATAVTHYLKLRYDAPACAGKPLAVHETQYTATVPIKGIYVCMEKVNGKPTLTVRSNSPYVWLLTGPKGGAVTPVQPTPPVDWAQIVTLAAYDTFTGKISARQTALVPGGVAGLAVTGSGPVRVQADVDASLGLIAIIVAGVDTLLTMSGTKLKLAELRAAGECTAGVVDAASDPDAGTVLRTVLDCVGSMVEGPAAIIVGLLTSLSSLLVTQLTGIVDELRGANHSTITVTGTSTRPPAPAGFTITMDGIAGARIGMRMSRFAAALGGKGSTPYFESTCASGGFRAGGVDFGLLGDTGGGADPYVNVVSVGASGGPAHHNEASVRTPKGVHIGSRTRDVLAAYPGVERSAHEYILGGEYLTVFNADHTKAIVFETGQNQVVTTINAGTVPQVQYVEGCS